MDPLVQLFIQEIVWLYGAPISIISDWDPHFISKFWPNLYLAIPSICNWFGDIQFEIGRWVFLMASLWKQVPGFGKNVNFIPRYIGPYEIIEIPYNIIYILQLLTNM